MIGTIAKLYSYRKAPSRTAMLLHPVKYGAIKALWPGKNDHATARKVAMGVGAAAVALPLGFWLSNKVGQPAE